MTYWLATCIHRWKYLWHAALRNVFHNVIPVVAATLEGDRNKIQTALLAGTSIPFVMFVLWDAAVLGSVSAEDAAAAAAMVAAGGSVADPLATLRGTSATAAALVQGFSFFAISTSFLGFVLGLTDFLADGLQLSTGSRNDPRPYLIALVPPTIFAISYPDIFLSALDSAVGSIPVNTSVAYPPRPSSASVIRHPYRIHARKIIMCPEMNHRDIVATSVPV